MKYKKLIIQDLTLNTDPQHSVPTPTLDPASADERTGVEAACGDPSHPGNRDQRLGGERPLAKYEHGQGGSNLAAVACERGNPTRGRERDAKGHI